ncbi:MAG: hypothetical protein IJZ04_08725 [Clostridia bacterium]|nr:hypothetical protein [Clostridia bacterium]
MTESIKETVSQLYALRAGISLISKNLDNHELEYQESLDKINDFEYKIGEYEEQSKKYAPRELEYAKRELKLANIKLKFMKFLWFACWTLAIALLLIGVAFIVAFVKLEIEWYIAPGIFSCLAGFFGSVCLIAFTIPPCEPFYSDAEFERKRKEKWLKEITNGMKEFSSKKSNGYLNKLIENCNKVREESILLEKGEDEYTRRGNAIYTALVNEYSKILDIRDWENIDLIIFYLETGRAESMKEALQQVDRQRQMDSIVEAIATASRQICFTIQRGMEHINSTIISSAKLLSSQIEGISTQLTGVNNLLTAHSMQNALEEKADASSIQLMEDVHQMRIYADNAEVKRRNS